jgi:hypothetical protein
MRRFMYGTHVLLHISVVLFFWALSDFFYTVDHRFGLVTRYTLVASAIVYILFSISPLIYSSCPYSTPMTPPLRAGIIILRIIIRSPSWFPKWFLKWYQKWFPEWYRGSKPEPFDLTGLEYYKGIHFDRAHLYSMEAEKRAEKLEPYAMNWLFTEDDFDEDDMDKFLEGLPGYISSSLTEERRLDEYLAAKHIFARIKEHFITCATSVELSNKASIARVFFCVKALLRVFEYSRECKEKPSVPAGELEEVLQFQKEYIQELIKDFQSLCEVDDPMIALRASCITALAVQGLLSELVLPVSKTTDSSRFPISLIPIYTFFFAEENKDTILRLDKGGMVTPEENRSMWNSLLHDGPVANLTTLGETVLEREQGHAPPLTLSFCWETLDILLTQIRAIHFTEPPRVQNDFDDLHETTRAHYHSEVQGFRVRPLLDILDTVARGRRFLMVFSNHPKYRNRVDVEFGKEDLRNGDLLEAFAHCLPNFILSNTPEVRGDLMEKVIRDDDLWTSLQVNLENTQKSDSPTPDRLRVFEDCCTVLDVAFSVLEDSRKVDWRAREFVSLLQRFESFITRCFRGAFIRTTRFRVGIIKARFSKALLAQFWNDRDSESTVSFRSQWDVASLARLIYTLGLRDEEDAEFWNSYFHRGYIADSTVKAPGMAEIIACGGPLLIFCQLGHLIATALPLDQSGIKIKDIVKVWKLQEKVIENTHLPLDRISDPVWEAIDQLREQVDGLRGKNKGKDRGILRRLLRMIDDVAISVAKHSTSPSESGEPPGVRSHQFSFASESTAVTGGPSRGSQTSEGEDGFGSASSLLIPRASVDLQPESSAHNVLDRERKRSESPDWAESPQSYESDFHGLSSLHRTFPGFSPTRQSLSLVSRASTDAAPFTWRRDAHTVRRNPAIILPYESFDLSDEGQSGADPTSDEE